MYVQKAESNPASFGTAPYRDVAAMRTQALLQYEKELHLTDPTIYLEFFDRIESLRRETVTFIQDARGKGKSVWVYGASTKGNTLLQYFGIDSTMIDAASDRQSIKWGRRTVGTNIPITSDEDMRRANPDYVLVLPWHFINEFKQREADYLKGGGKFIVPCPKFDIIGR